MTLDNFRGPLAVALVIDKADLRASLSRAKKSELLSFLAKVLQLREGELRIPQTFTTSVKGRLDDLAEALEAEILSRGKDPDNLEP